MPNRVTLVSMSGLRVGHEGLLALGMSLPGLSRRAAALSQLPPLGLLTVAATLDESWEVELVGDEGSQPVDATVEAIVQTRPDVVAFSTLTPAADRACDISNRVRKSCGVKTIVGGLHATAAPWHLEPHFDVVIRGDGEPAFANALASCLGISPHLALEDTGTLEDTGPYQLAHSPVPRWDLLGDKVPPRYTLQTMRGCPWACSFCAASRLLGPARTKPDHQIRLELDAITERQSRPWIELADDNTFASSRDHQPMLEMLQLAGARWFTESDWRIGQRPELLRQIAKSGCRQILIGLESSVFRYPGMGAKTADFDEMLEAIAAIQEAGIVVNACFIVGADGETEASIERLGDFLATASFGEIQLTLQTPFPGTSLYDSLSKQDRLLPGDFSRYTLFDVVYQPDMMTAGQLERSFHRLAERVFCAESQRRRDRVCRDIRRNIRPRYYSNSDQHHE